MPDDVDAAGGCENARLARESSNRRVQFRQKCFISARPAIKLAPMQYMLLIYLDENALTETQREQCYRDSAGLARQLHTKRQYVSAAPLYPTSSAKSVRVKNGKAMVTDGPFAETHEQLGGFFLIEADSMEKATEIARQIPAGKWGTVEVRPVLQVEGLPEAASA